MSKFCIHITRIFFQNNVCYTMSTFVLNILRLLKRHIISFILPHNKKKWKLLDTCQQTQYNLYLTFIAHCFHRHYGEIKLLIKYCNLFLSLLFDNFKGNFGLKNVRNLCSIQCNWKSFCRLLVIASKISNPKYNPLYP